MGENELVAQAEKAYKETKAQAEKDTEGKTAQKGG